MSMRMSFCIKAATTLRDHDLTTLTDSIEHYVRAGMSSEMAERAAVDDLAAQIKGERSEMVDLVKQQHADLFKSDRMMPKVPAAGRAVQPIRGSDALGQISERLGGMSPLLLPDLSQKVVRTRTSKTGKQTQYTVWDNPPQPGVGPLFRKGGTADMSEVARVLEEQGYIEFGLGESDPGAARQQAETIVKAELSHGGATLQQGNAGAIDAAMRDRIAEEEPWDSFLFTPDDLHAAGYDELDPAVQEATRQLVQEADGLGLDTEALKDQSARSTQDLTEHDYHAHLQAAVQAAVVESRRAAVQAEPGAAQQRGANGVETASEARSPGSDERPGGPDAAGPADRPGLTLEAQTPESLRAKAAQETAGTQAERDAQAAIDRKAAGDAQRGDFTLTGSDRAADAHSGQGDLNLSQSADLEATQVLPRPEVIERGPVPQQDTDAVAKLTAAFKQVESLKALKLEALPRLLKPSDDAPAIAKERYAAADLSEKLFGKRVVYFSSNIMFANGVQADYLPHMVFINEATSRPVMAVLGHELLHSLRQAHPELYTKLGDRLRSVLESPGRYGELLNAKRKSRGFEPLSFDKLREELVADIVGDNFTDPQFWREMSAGQPTLFGRVLRVVRDFFDGILAKLRRERPYGTAQYLNDVQGARDAVVEAMRTFANSPKTASDAVTRAAENTMSTSIEEKDQTQRPEFKRWFGDSKVVDANGKPLVVYHGTGKDFAEFKARTARTIWFAKDGAYASKYQSTAPDAANQVMPVYLKLENPLVIDMRGGENLPKGLKGVLGQANTLEDAAGVAQQQGHDGIVFQNRKKTIEGYSGDEYGVFSPEQIKSATGNSGAFDSSNPDIRASLAEDEPNLSMPDYSPEEREALKKAGINTDSRLQRLGDRIRKGYVNAQASLQSNWARQFQQGALDQFTGINEAIKRDVGGLPVDQDPYVAARLANGGASSVMRGLMLHGQARWAANGQHLEKIPGTEGLLDILAPLGKDLNGFFGWMIGNRAARLHAEGRENNFTPADIAALQGLNKGKEAEFRKAALAYAAFKRSVLDIGEKAGLIDAEGRKVWDQADYIPFYRQMEDRGMLSATGKKGLSGQTSGIRQLKGGEAALNDPMENIVMNFSKLIDASLKNSALAKTVDTLTAAKSDAIEKVGYDMTKQLVPADQVRKVLQAAGTPDQVLDIIPPDAFDGMAKMWAIQAPVDKDVVRIMVGGKPQFYKVHDPLLLKAATSFVPFDFPGLGVMRAFKRVLTRTVTMTPEFMARNFIRDSVASAMISRDGFNPAKSLTGIVKSYSEKGGYEDMLFAGASFQSGNINAADPTSTATAMRRALRKKGMSAASANAFMSSILDTPAKFWEKYRHVGEAIENANREAVFEATQRKTGSTTAAAYEAKDLMDFTLRGSSPVYQLLADVLPFFNARVQGLYRLGRADPKKVAAYGMLMAAAAIALAMANHGNPDYDELPDWDKDTYWHVWIGGKHFRIPKPFELGVAFATIPERIYQYMVGDITGKKLAERLWANVRDQLAFDPVPQSIRPLLNSWANKDTFRDSPIEGMADEGKLPSQRYSKMTSATAVAAVKAVAPAADFIGLSPKKLEYLIGGYLGTAGQYALGLSDIVVRKLNNEPPQPALRLDQIPFVRAFYREAPAFSTVYETDLYKMRTEVDQVFKSVNALKKDDKPDEAAALQDKNEDLLSVRKVIERTAHRLAALNKRRDAIYADREMTPAEKRTAIDEILRQKAEIAKETMKEEEVLKAQ